MDGMQHLYAPPSGLAIGKVSETVDPQSRGRVQVSLLAAGMDVWAACLVPSAGGASGPQYGVALLPKKGEIVLVAFLTPDQAFVIGAVWNGQNAAPSESAPVEQRYAIKTKQGISLVFDDAAPSLSITMPSGNAIVLDDAASTCTVTVGTTTIQATASGATVTTSASIELKSGAVTITAPTVTVNASMAQFSGAIQCDSIISNTVMGAAYTPGAGNIW
jgi:uncharacterized protein involved in type VI secretion and phage assembly